MITAQQQRAGWEQLWLPRWPLAADDFAAGIHRMPRDAALGRRHIEANPQHWCNLLVADIDHPDAALRALSSTGNHPMPNAIVENPRNGHAHAVWALSAPFPRTEYAHRKPLAYAAAVSEGLRRAVSGDQGYSGLMTHNPLHDAWETLWLHDEARSLAELEHELGTNMPPKRWRQTKRQRARPAGLGRNCHLFDTARDWAYREIRHHFGDPQGLADAIHREAATLNAEFPEPLPDTEARAIAASITRWITTRSRLWADGPAVYEATFTTIQAARGRKMSEKRREALTASNQRRSKITHAEIQEFVL